MMCTLRSWEGSTCNHPRDFENPIAIVVLLFSFFFQSWHYPSGVISFFSGLHFFASAFDSCCDTVRGFSPIDGIDIFPDCMSSGDGRGPAIRCIRGSADMLQACPLFTHHFVLVYACCWIWFFNQFNWIAFKNKTYRDKFMTAFTAQMLLHIQLPISVRTFENLYMRGVWQWKKLHIHTEINIMLRGEEAHEVPNSRLLSFWLIVCDLNWSEFVRLHPTWCEFPSRFFL